jgi:hypothetical protein
VKERLKEQKAQLEKEVALLKIVQHRRDGKRDNATTRHTQWHTIANPEAAARRARMHEEAEFDKI